MKRKVTIVILAIWIMAVLCISVFVVRGCRFPGPTDPAALVGKYEDLGREDKYFLELRADNTYSQRIVRADGSELTNTGHWESGYSDAGPRIKLSNFKSFWAGRLQTAGLWNAYVSRTLLGRTKLVFGDHLVFSYSGPLPQEKEPNE